jgi:hypothetical protein
MPKLTRLWRLARARWWATVSRAAGAVGAVRLAAWALRAMLRALRDVDWGHP